MNFRLLCFVLTWTICATVVGEPTTFIHVGRGTGTLDGASFQDLPFTITAIADTDNREFYDSGISVDHDAASIVIEGLGSYTFLLDTRTFNNTSSGVVGFSRSTTNGTDLHSGPEDEVFKSWEILTSIGPISGEVNLLQWDDDNGVETDGGLLFFENESTPGSFQAIVPEPSAWWLVSIGAAAVLGQQRRKR